MNHKPIIYGSVCSGIEAASVAWNPLGWKCAFVSEIEPFPCAVLKHHYPAVPNFGDMTKYEKWPKLSIDVLIGGTPCQSFSVAGLRAGLADPRGNLALTFLGIIDKYRPQWVLWENVPGVHSSWSDVATSAATQESYNPIEKALGDLRATGIDLGADFSPGQFEEVDQSNDFDCFLSGLEELSYGIATCVLDAEYFGVPQRRRRVFVVGHIGGQWQRAAAVLLERYSLQGNPPPSRQKGQGVAPTISARTKGGGGLGTDFDCDGGLIADQGGASVTPAVTSKWAKGSGGPAGDECQNLIPTSHGGFFDDTGATRGTPQIATNTGRGYWKESNKASPLGTEARAIHESTLLAFSVKDHGADAGEVAPTLRAGTHDQSHANGGCGPAIAQAVSFQPHYFTRDNKTGGVESCGDTTAALSADHGGGDSAPHVAAFQSSQSGIRQADTHATLDANNGSRRHNGIVQEMAVRRLTPRECERLQGFPDDHTLIPFRGKPAADGNRYRALGNSMAVPVIRHIGERIQLIDDLKP